MDLGAANKGVAMEWWVGVLLVVVPLAALLGFFEWRSRNRPMPGSLERGGRHDDNPSVEWGGIARHDDLKKPHD